MISYLTPQPATYSRKEREIAALLLRGAAPKRIGDHLELAETTVRDRIRRMCRAAGVADRGELIVWFLQHPAALQRGGEIQPGLHPHHCLCGSWYCAGMAQLGLVA